jgi:hypothetical protein
MNQLTIAIAILLASYEVAAADLLSTKSHWESAFKEDVGESIDISADKMIFASNKCKTEYKNIDYFKNEAGTETYIFKKTQEVLNSCGWEYIRMSIRVNFGCYSITFFYNEDKIFDMDKASGWLGRYYSHTSVFDPAGKKCP